MKPKRTANNTTKIDPHNRSETWKRNKNHPSDATSRKRRSNSIRDARPEHLSRVITSLGLPGGDPHFYVDLEPRRGGLTLPLREGRGALTPLMVGYRSFFLGWVRKPSMRRYKLLSVAASARAFSRSFETSAWITLEFGSRVRAAVSASRPSFTSPWMPRICREGEWVGLVGQASGSSV